MNNFTIDNSTDAELHADQWHEMSVHQLNAQRDLIVTKLSTMLNLMEFNSGNSTVQLIYRSLQIALNDLNYLIDTKVN